MKRLIDALYYLRCNGITNPRFECIYGRMTGYFQFRWLYAREKSQWHVSTDCATKGLWSLQVFAGRFELYIIGPFKWVREEAA